MLGKALISFVFLVLAMAALASPASASGEWGVEGNKLAETETFTMSGGTLTLTGKAGLVVECKKTEGNGKVFKGNTDEFTASFSTCKVLESSTCKVKEPLVINAEAVLVHGSGGTYYEEIRPIKESKAMATVVLEGKECTLAKENVLAGSVAAGLSPEESATRTIKTSKSFSETAEKEGGKYELTFGGAKSTMTSELGMKLSGAHAGAEWFRNVMTKLCGKEAVMGTCPAESLYEELTVIWLENEVDFNFNVGLASFSCEQSVPIGKTHFDEGEPLIGVIETWTFTCGGGCTIEPLSLPYEFFFSKRADGNGHFRILQVEFKIVCAAGTCMYTEDPLYFGNVHDGTPAKALANGLFLTKAAGSAMGCANLATWVGAGAPGTVIYRFQFPQPLFVTS